MGVSHFCCCVALEQKGICNLQEEAGEADVKVPFNYFLVSLSALLISLVAAQLSNRNLSLLSDHQPNGIH